MERDYVRSWSRALGREMELLHFGHAGVPVLAFPTSMGRFFQWEDFGMVGSLAARIAGGAVRLWCVDSVDSESWYSSERAPEDRVSRHLEYERYVLDERLLGPLRAMRPMVLATGSEDANVQDSVTLGEQLRAKGIEVRLYLWPGWQHDWPYWQRMLDHYL